MQKLLHFFAVIIALYKNYRKKNCKYLQCAKKIAKKHDIFSAYYCATEKWAANICKTQKKSQQNTIFLALIIALRKYYRKNKRKYLRIAN